MAIQRARLGSTLRLALGPGPDRHRYTRRFPFQRKPWVIAVLAGLDLLFLLPSVAVFRQAASAWAGADQLFDLAIAIFLSAWLLAWSLAPLVLTLLLVVVLFGRELLTAGPGRLSLEIGVPGLGVRVTYLAEHVRQLRSVSPEAKSGHAWRGDHLAFGYGSTQVRFGSMVDGDTVPQLLAELEAATGSRIQNRPATEDELAQERSENQADSLETDRETLAATVPAPGTFAAADPAPPLTLSSPSTLALIVANLVPLLGTLFFGWNLGDVMVLYWAETAIIGLFNVLKIIMIGRWSALLAGPFFIGHFSAFMAIHFLFINLFFLGGMQSGMDSSVSDVALIFSGLIPALLALLVSHGFSFLHNFVGQQEYLDRSVSKQMSEPYSRVIFMHLVIIFGGGLALVMGEPTLVILLTILAKIAVDVRAHLKQHAAGSNRAAVAS